MLWDVYPSEESVYIRILTESYACGIFQKLQNARPIDDFLCNRLVRNLVEEYGYRKELATWCIASWRSAIEKTPSPSYPSDETEKNPPTPPTLQSIRQKQSQTSTQTAPLPQWVQNALNRSAQRPAASFRQATQPQPTMTFVQTCNPNDFEIVNGCLARYKGSSPHVNIPIGVIKITKNAFSGCTFLQSVTIPDTVTGIGMEAFSGCKELTSVHIPESVRSIEEGAFAFCQKLSEIILPNYITTLENRLFEGCFKLNHVVLPANIKSIGIWTFKSCSDLSCIHYRNTIAQWSLIKRNGDWKWLSSITLVSCTNGMIEV